MKAKHPTVVTRTHVNKTIEFFKELGIRTSYFENEVFIDHDKSTLSLGVQLGTSSKTARDIVAALKSVGFKKKHQEEFGSSTEVCMTHPAIEGSEVYIDQLGILGATINLCQVYSLSK